MSIHYDEQNWNDGSAGNTPITADALGHIEEGIGAAHDRLDVLSVGMILTPTDLRTTTVAPAAGELVTYDAAGGNIGPIPLPVPQSGVIMGVAKGDATANTITFTGTLIGNGGSNTITLRVTGEGRTFYGDDSGWYVVGFRAPVVGTTAGTFAAGDDSRFENTLGDYLFGDSSRSYAPICEVRYTATPFNVGASDVYAQGGWTRAEDDDLMLGTSGGFSVITIPLAGRYEYFYTCSSSTSTAGGSCNIRITRNTAHFTASIATDVRPSFPNGGVVKLTCSGSSYLNAGDRLFWGNYCSVGTQTVSPWGPASGSVMDWTRIIVRYVGDR